MPPPRVDPSDLRARTAPPVALVRSLVVRGQQSGEFEPELPADWLVTVVVELIHAASRQVTSGSMSSRAAQEALLRSASAMLKRQSAVRR